MVWVLDEALKGMTGRKAIVVLTDGCDNGSKANADRVKESVLKTDAVVYSLLVDTADEQIYRLNQVIHRRAARGGPLGRTEIIGSDKAESLESIAAKGHSAGIHHAFPGHHRLVTASHSRRAAAMFLLRGHWRDRSLTVPSLSTLTPSGGDDRPG